MSSVGSRPAPKGGELSGVRAIVTNAETRIGLYVIRALGRAGCRVTALSSKQSGTVIGFSSRYAAERHRLPNGPYGKRLPEMVESLAARHDVLVPISAIAIAIVAFASERLESLIPYYIPGFEALRTAQDKRATTRIGREVGVPVPATYDNLDPTTIGDWAASMAAKLPLVVKFADDRRSGGWKPADRYRIVRTPDELIHEYGRMHELGEFPLVQEYIEGDGYGFFTLMGPSGHPVTTFCHRRLREYPVAGGPSTLCESVHDDTLVELGTRLLGAMDWRGVAMVEFKRDRKSGEYKLLEINPRFWGSLPLALHCGVNFPVYQVQLALGRSPMPPVEYAVGRKMRFFFPDFLAVRQQWASGDKRAISARYVKELLDISIKDGIFDIDDPGSFVAYVRQNLGR